jgi:hypothetical protein
MTPSPHLSKGGRRERAKVSGPRTQKLEFASRGLPQGEEAEGQAAVGVVRDLGKHGLEGPQVPVQEAADQPPGQGLCKRETQRILRVERH